MRLKIIEHPKIDLNIGQMVCDYSLGEHFERTPMLKCLDGFRFTAIIGRPGSGKTSTLISWLNGSGAKKVFRKVFDHVLLVMPSCSRESIKTSPFKKHDPAKCYEELTLETADAIHQKLLATSEEKETTLLVLDDIGASLKNKEIQRILRMILFNRRHLKVHVLVLLQSYISMPKEIRKLLDNVVMFKPSKVEFENLFAELFETKRDDALALMSMAYTDPHDSLFLNVPSQRIFSDYDEIVMSDNEDD